MLAGDRDARHRRPIERCALAGDNRRSSSEPPADADVCDEPPESRGCWCDKRLSASGRRAALPWVERDVRRRTRRHRLPSGTCRLPDHADKHRQPPDAARGPRRSMQRGGDAICIGAYLFVRWRAPSSRRAEIDQFVGRALLASALVF